MSELLTWSLRMYSWDLCRTLQTTVCIVCIDDGICNPLLPPAVLGRERPLSNLNWKIDLSSMQCDMVVNKKFQRKICNIHILNTFFDDIFSMYCISVCESICPKSNTREKRLGGKGCTLYTKCLMGTRPKNTHWYKISKTFFSTIAQFQKFEKIWKQYHKT